VGGYYYESIPIRFEFLGFHNMKIVSDKTG